MKFFGKAIQGEKAARGDNLGVYMEDRKPCIYSAVRKEIHSEKRLER